MANLYTGTLNFKGYKTVTELTGVTFEADTTYTIQIQGGAYIREGQNGEGFLIPDESPFQYTASVDDLYIKMLKEEIGNIVINIAD